MHQLSTAEDETVSICVRLLSVFHETLKESETSRLHLLKVRGKLSAGHVPKPLKRLPRNFLACCWNTTILRISKQANHGVRLASYTNPGSLLAGHSNHMVSPWLVPHTADEIARTCRSRKTINNRNWYGYSPVS